MHDLTGGTVAESPITITVLMFSGRPNPFWSLAGTDAERVIAALQSLPATSEPAPPSPGLGYQGVSIEIADAGRSVEWHLYSGIAVANGTRYADLDRSVERMLIETGRGVLDPSVLSTIVQGL